MTTLCKRQAIAFPTYSGTRCLMMPYIQGDPDSVPRDYWQYKDILKSLFLQEGEVGYLTIDESPAKAGKPHRGERAKYARALHTEAGKHPVNNVHKWGWGTSYNVTLDPRTRILLANNLDGSCALWDAEHPDTSLDGDIGHLAHLYPYDEAVYMQAGEVWEIGILNPHESLPVQLPFRRQFLRIVGAGVYGREPYFTVNPLMAN